jgi:acetyl-CoA carboxylase biotin carboxyl carrier protein
VPGTPPQDADASSQRAEDHAAIDRLADELLPALIAKLAATGLGELEVREGDWKVRLRRPATPAGKRSSERSSRGSSAHASHPAVATLTPVGPGRDGRDGRDGADPRRSVATSPAVGIFQPRTGVRAGTRVRAGDRLGIVDMLGVAQEVVTPVDGLVGASLVEPGDAVEYGQELIVIELVTAAAPGGDA